MSFKALNCSSFLNSTFPMTNRVPSGKRGRDEEQEKSAKNGQQKIATKKERSPSLSSSLPPSPPASPPAASISLTRARAVDVNLDAVEVGSAASRFGLLSCAGYGYAGWSLQQLQSECKKRGLQINAKDSVAMLIDCLQKDAEKKAVTVESLQVRIGREFLKMMQAGPSSYGYILFEVPGEMAKENVNRLWRSLETRYSHIECFDALQKKWIVVPPEIDFLKKDSISRKYRVDAKTSIAHPVVRKIRL